MTIEQLNSDRSELVARKNELMRKLSDIKTRLLTTLPHTQFAAFEASRLDTIKELGMLDAQLALLNAKKGKVHAEQNEANREECVPHIKALVEMRDYYQQFAADGSRSPTMRRMASEFTLKLTPIIRQIIKRSGNADA